MSHAIYSFLIDIADPETDDTELVAEVLSSFTDWTEKHCDENNWYQEMALVLANGRTVSLCSPGDYRGRDGLAGQIAGKPQEARWEWARLFALRCVATDLQIGGRPTYSLGIEPERPDEEYWCNFLLLQQQILDEVPPRLAELWNRGSLVPDSGQDESDQLTTFVEMWRRSDLSSRMCLYLNSIRNGHPPFSNDGNPYDYRAFNLADSDSPEYHAIVFVDIHT